MLRTCFLVLFLSLAAVRAEPPNIVFILADDLGINDLASYGREDHSTPHLDRLAAEGMRFTSAYCAQPICSPTRAALLTGKTPARLKLTSFLPGRADAPSQRLLQAKMAMQLALEERTIAEALRPAGYVSACIGKWHLGGPGFGPKEQGFDVVSSAPGKSEPSATEGGKSEFALTAQAEQFLEANQARPFFLYLAHHSPHIPLAAQTPRLAEHGEAFNPVYAAVIETLDEAVGRILAKLDALGLTEKTMVVFTSDNGGLHVLEGAGTPATQNTPFRAGKGFLYEGGLRVPLLVRWPGKVTAGSLCKVPMISTDWLPTLLAAVGADADPSLDGSSVLPLLTGTEVPKRALTWHFPHYTNQGSRPAGAIREGDWKLVEHYEDGRAELFDLASDPGEQADRAGEMPDKAAELRGKLATWRQKVGAIENTPNPRFDPNLAEALYQAVDVSLLEPAATSAEQAQPLAAWAAAMRRAVALEAVTPAARPVILLHARDAKIHGATLRFEPAPHKNTLGFWSKVEDWASWDFELKTPGEYAIEILQGYKGKEGAEVDFSVGDQTISTLIEPTGHFQNFLPRIIGRVKLAAGKHTFVVRPKTKPGGAVMDLRQIVLVPPADEPKEKDEAP